MATTLEKDGALEITSISADWDYRTERPSHWPKHPRLTSISFHPGGADILIIKQHDANGVTRFKASCEDFHDDRIKYFHGSRVVPFIPYAECTFNTGHLIIIELWREP